MINSEEMGLDPDSHQSLTGGGQCDLHWHELPNQHDVLEVFEGLYKVSTIDTSSTVAPLDDIVLVDTTAGNITVTLPPSKGMREFRIIKAAAGNQLTVQFSGAENCFGTTSYDVVTLGDVLHFKAYNGGWLKL